MKKASLSLSVNAIVIFVIAFAMLGFGLFIIQKLQSQSDDWITQSFQIDDFEKPPTSEDPIVFSDTLNLKPTGTKRMALGVLNIQAQTINNAAPKFVKCTGTLNDELEGDVEADDSEDMPGIYFDVLPNSLGEGEEYGYRINVITNSATSGEYVCEIGIGEYETDIPDQSNREDADYVSFSEQFDVTISN